MGIGRSEMTGKRFVLIKNMPGLKAGAIFVHMKYSNARPDVGNVGCGALVLAWSPEGNCQQNWCGGAFILPGQMFNEEEWFSPECECKCHVHCPKESKP